MTQDILILICIPAAIFLIIIIGLLIDNILFKLAIETSNKKIADMFAQKVIFNTSNDNKMSKEQIDYYKHKYPLVTEEFLNKTPEEQLIENNFLLQEAKKRTAELKNKATEIEKRIAELENNTVELDNKFNELLSIAIELSKNIP